MTTFLIGMYVGLLAGYFLRLAHACDELAAKDLEIGLLRAQRDEARIDADEKWGTFCHDDSHTLRTPKEETHG